VMNSKRFYILTLGCKINQYESEAIRESWLEQGFVEVSDPKKADVILINSCAVTHMAVSDTKKYARRFIRENPGCELIITGCAIPRFEEEIKSIQGISLLVPQKKKAILSLYPRQQDVNIEDIPDFALEIKDYFRARPLIKIQDGCSHYCRYCIVPLTRGPSVSRDVRRILDEVQRILAKGFKEIIISGINLREFKGIFRDRELDVWDLIFLISKEIVKDFPGARIRISSLDPSLLNDKALEVIGNCPEIVPHLHISIQSASPRILKKMGRAHYCVGDIETFLKKLTEIWPVFGLGCDILVGFPGEEEEDFRLTYEFCKNMPFTYAHVFQYSKRDGTPAAKYLDQVPKKIMHKRSSLLRELFLNKKKEFIRSLLKLDSLNIVVEDTKKSIGMCEYYIICKLQKTDGTLPRKGSILKGIPVDVDLKAMNVVVKQGG